MVNQQKSKCQLRLEERSRAYQWQHQQHADTAANSNQHADTNQKKNAAQLAAQMYSRIARATEARVSRQKQRKALARERVLHAQQVAQEQRAKRRAALSSGRVATCEKLEVAKQRRLSTLEQTQMSCKRRVERVREKVQSVKAVQKGRSERARRALERQLGDAALRREEQTQRMVQRLSERWQSVESVKDRVARAKFIQRWYRRHVDARKNASSLQLSTAHVARVVTCWQQVATRGFEESMLLLQDRELARAAQYVLRVLLPSAAAGDQSPNKAAPSPRKGGASFRVLLMVGMIAFHPNEIMEAGKCERLAYAAKQTHDDMLRIYGLLQHGTARELKTCVARLEAHFAFYFESFTRWKQNDAERLATEMLRSYHDIYKLKLQYVAKTQTVHEGDGVHQLVHQTEKQLLQLKSALAHVIGKDDTLARVAAIERSVEQQGTSSSPESEALEDEQEQRTEDSARDSEPSVASAQPPAASQAHQGHENAVRPPVQIESLLSDDKLVHELILNPSFRIPQVDDEAPSGSLAARVRDQMLQAFWDQVVASNDIATLLTRTEELRVGFANVMKIRPDLVEDVNVALQTGVLEAMMQHPEANFVEIKARCVRVVQSIRQAEAPARNDATHAFLTQFEDGFAALQAASDNGSNANVSAVRLLVDFLAFALHKVEELRVDLMNAQFGMLATYLQRHGAEYEQKKLHEKLAAGTRFDMTEKWLAMEMTKYWGTLTDDEKDHMARYDSGAFSKFLRESMMALIGTHIEGNSGVWPESFALDVDRIRGLRDAMDRITIVASLLVVVQEHIARRRLVVPRDFFRRIGTQLTTLLLSPGISGAHLVTQAVQEIRTLEAKRTQQSEEYEAELEALEQRLHGAFGTANPVFKLFSDRVFSTMLNAQLNEDSEVEVHASLAPFDADLRELAAAMRKLAKHNETVYASLYNAIVKQLVAAM
uniref:Uncharacterized protein n=1 Tax=Globisporangium ultimum (strain ATCC 200006 / CBS 805.95 / DAOM BR144) TaxID=431595 RepID=K3X6Q9_GLOUD